MRLFVAIDIDDNIRSRIARFLDGVREFAPDVRWVRPESLHVTLKFIGEKSDDEVETIKRALATIAADSFELIFRGYGFFPGARAPRVFWIGSEGGSKLTSLAATVDETLARGGGGSGSRRRNGGGRDHSFQRLQQKLAALAAPEFGTMTAREFFLYRSKLSPSGSKYTKLAGFALRSEAK